MGTQRYRTYSKEFKQEALELLESSGKSAFGVRKTKTCKHRELEPAKCLISVTRQTKAGPNTRRWIY